jgi:hypothetical protein
MSDDPIESSPINSSPIQINDDNIINTTLNDSSGNNDLPSLSQSNTPSLGPVSSVAMSPDQITSSPLSSSPPRISNQIPIAPSISSVNKSSTPSNISSKISPPSSPTQSVSSRISSDVSISKSTPVPKSSSDKPLTNKPLSNKPSSDKPLSNKPSSDKSSSDKPLSNKPSSDKSSSDKPLSNKPSSDKPSSDKSLSNKPSSDKPSSDKSLSNKPSSDKPSSDKSLSNKPSSDKPPPIARMKGNVTREENRSEPSEPIEGLNTFLSSTSRVTSPRATSPRATSSQPKSSQSVSSQPKSSQSVSSQPKSSQSVSSQPKSSQSVSSQPKSSQSVSSQSVSSQSVSSKSSQSSITSPSRMRPTSPRDPTPIVVNGKIIDREDIPSIPVNTTIPKINFKQPPTHNVPEPVSRAAPPATKKNINDSINSAGTSTQPVRRISRVQSPDRKTTSASQISDRQEIPILNQSNTKPSTLGQVRSETPLRTYNESNTSGETLNMIKQQSSSKQSSSKQSSSRQPSSKQPSSRQSSSRQSSSRQPSFGQPSSKQPSSKQSSSRQPSSKQSSSKQPSSKQSSSKQPSSKQSSSRQPSSRQSSSRQSSSRQSSSRQPSSRQQFSNNSVKNIEPLPPYMDTSILSDSPVNIPGNSSIYYEHMSGYSSNESYTDGSYTEDSNSVSSDSYPDEDEYDQREFNTRSAAKNNHRFHLREFSRPDRWTGSRRSHPNYTHPHYTHPNYTHPQQGFDLPERSNVRKSSTIDNEYESNIKNVPKHRETAARSYDYFNREAMKPQSKESELDLEEEKKTSGVEETNTVTNENEVPDYDIMNDIEIAECHADFRVKFGILRNAFPEMNIPNYDDDVNLKIKHAHYVRYLRHIHVDNSISNYRLYLIVFWLGLELFGVKVLGLSVSGFTQRQFESMRQYEHLLQELGEKSNTSIGSEWPVEVRILFMSLVNAIVFVVIKYLADWAGPSLGPMLENFIQSILSNGMGNPAESGPDPSENRSSGSGLPDPQPGAGGFNMGGLDMGSLISNFGTMFTQNMSGGGGNRNSAPAPQASRRPRFNE